VAAERVDADGQAAQARPAIGVGAAHAVVGDRDGQALVGDEQLAAGALGPRVLRDVRERLRAHESTRPPRPPPAGGRWARQR
jgi:hypothetical protein